MLIFASFHVRYVGAMGRGEKKEPHRLEIISRKMLYERDGV